MELPAPITQALQQVINTSIGNDLDLQHILKNIEDRSVTLHLSGFELSLHFFIHHNNIEILNQYAGNLDTEISITPIALFSLVNGSDSAEKLSLDINGDQALAGQFLKLLPLLKIDWEKHLSHLTGGVVATQIGSQLRQNKQEQKRNWQSMQSNISEYLQEEIQLTPSKQAFEKLADSNERLRQKLKDLARRVDTLNDK